jgi:integrase
VLSTPTALSPLLPTSIRKQIKTIPQIQSFLESVLRNSKSTRNVYESGINYFHVFLDQSGLNHNAATILDPLAKNEINLYELFDSFVAFLVSSGLSIPSIRLYVVAIRSYFAYHDLDVIPAKFKRKVRMPKLYREDEQPIDTEDIRKILLSCNNRRLKAYLLVLASGAMRAVEALAVRVKDCDFSVSPTKIHIRKEYAKTRVARDIFISDEATQYLKQWIDWKYRDKGDEWTKNKDPNDLVFSVYKTANTPNPNYLYSKILKEFERLLMVVGLDERKEEGRKTRRKITLHSLRRYAKGVISNQVNQDYSEWFLGHAKSPYYTLKETDKREIYASKVMKYLTFLDYTILEATGKSIEAKLSEKENEIQQLRNKYDADIILLKDAISDMQQLLKNPKKLVEVSQTSIHEAF